MDGSRRVLFVAGLARSGSTALDFILGNRPGGFSLGEISAWYRPYREHHIEPRCACGRLWHECPVWRRVGHPKARHLHRTVADVLEVATVVDSSKDLSWIHEAYRWAAADGMQPHVILCWRAPQGLAFSYWKRGEAELSVGSARDLLRSLERYVRRLDDLGVGYQVVSFDELISDPTTTLEKLHSEVGMQPWPGQERFWEGESHCMFGSSGTRDQQHAPSAQLAPPEFPPAFLEYWDGLPVVWRQGLDELNARILSRSSVPATPRRLPPRWYLKRRIVAFRHGDFRLRMARRR